jgi:hypothetical protein
MNYTKIEQAKAQALYLTATRQLDHVIYASNGGYEVTLKKFWTGPIVELVEYKPNENTEDKPESKKTTKGRLNPASTEDKPETV